MFIQHKRSRRIGAVVRTVTMTKPRAKNARTYHTVEVPFKNNDGHEVRVWRADRTIPVMRETYSLYARKQGIA